MNQREALVTVIEFIRDQGDPATLELKRALKVLEHRAEVLRLRYERKLTTVPADIMEEPLVIPYLQIVADQMGRICAAAGSVNTRGLPSAQNASIPSKMLSSGKPSG